MISGGGFSGALFEPDLSMPVGAKGHLILEREFNRSVRAARRAMWMGFILAFLLGVIFVTGGARGLRYHCLFLAPFYMPGAFYILATLHWRSRRDEAIRGRLHLQWMVVPDMPRPLFFYYTRAVFAPFARLMTQLSFWWAAGFLAMPTGMWTLQAYIAINHGAPVEKQTLVFLLGGGMFSCVAAIALALMATPFMSMALSLASAASSGLPDSFMGGLEGAPVRLPQDLDERWAGEQ
jgi:hypothetical protein